MAPYKSLQRRTVSHTHLLSVSLQYNGNGHKTSNQYREENPIKSRQAGSDRETDHNLLNENPRIENTKRKEMRKSE